MTRNFTGQAVDDYEFLKPTNERRWGRVLWQIRCLRCGRVMVGLNRKGQESKHSHVTPVCECRSALHFEIGQIAGGKEILDIRDEKVQVKCLQCGRERWIAKVSLGYIYKTQRSRCQHCGMKLTRNKAVVVLHKAGFTQASIAEILKVSHQRIEQLLKSEDQK